MKNQYYPFDDFLSLTIAGYGPNGEELPWREVAKRMREMPREKNSEMLAHLTRIYKSELEHHGEVKALEKFWEEVENQRDSGLLTNDMGKVLLDAKAGNIKAAQKMVRTNPYVIHLPFIALAMHHVVSKHKYCDSKGGSLAEIKDIWSEFLPKRTGGNITYSHADLKRLILLAEKQMAGEKKLNGSGKKVPITFSDAREAVAEALNISAEYLKRNIKIKTKRGREKK